MADFLASVFFYKNLPMRNEPYTAHYWTLSVEWQFYITFPILMAYSTDKFIKLALIIIIVIPFVCILSNANAPFLHNNSIGYGVAKVCLYMFWKGPVIILIGSVFAILMFKGIIRPERFNVNYFLSFALLVFVIVLTSKKFVIYEKYASEYLAAIITAIAIIITISKHDFLATLLTNRFLRRIGILSYSIYIWQELFIGLRAWQPWLHHFINYPLWAIMGIKLIALAMIATASYCFESVFLRMKTRSANNDQMFLP